MLQGKTGWVANGNIGKCRFVEQVTTLDGRVTEANAATDYCIGISGEGSFNVPALGLDTTYHAIVDYPCLVYTIGDVCLLEISAAVTRGARLHASAADGRGVTALAAEPAFARALQSGSAAGERILVEVIQDTVNT